VWWSTDVIRQCWCISSIPCFMAATCSATYICATTELTWNNCRTFDTNLLARGLLQHVGSDSMTASSEASNNAYIPQDMKTHIPTTSLHCLNRKLPLSQIHMHPFVGHTAETVHWNRFELPTSQLVQGH